MCLFSPADMKGLLFDVLLSLSQMSMQICLLDFCVNESLCHEVQMHHGNWSSWKIRGVQSAVTCPFLSDVGGAVNQQVFLLHSCHHPHLPSQNVYQYWNKRVPWECHSSGFHAEWNVASLLYISMFMLKVSTMCVRRISCLFFLSHYVRLSLGQLKGFSSSLFDYLQIMKKDFFWIFSVLFCNK